MKILIIIILMINITFSNAQNLDREYNLQLPNYQTIYLSRNDSIFIIYFFPKIEKYDSTFVELHAVKFSKNKWINVPHTDTTFTIIKFRKKSKSQWFKKNNGMIFNADYECKVQRYWSYKTNNKIIEFVNYGIFSKVKIKKKNQSTKNYITIE